MDYKNRAYFTNILSRVKSVMLKTGGTPWFEPPLFNKGAPLSAEEVHDNFQILTSGELNLNERVVNLEDTKVEATQNIKGVLAFHGLEEREGYLYGGRPLEVKASVNAVNDLIADSLVISAPSNAEFYISEGNSLAYITGAEIDDELTKWYKININNTGTLPTIISVLNSKLINDGSLFRFTGIDLSGYFATRTNWGSLSPYPVFQISFNDEPYRNVTLNTNCGDGNSAAVHLKAQILQAWPEYNGTFDVVNNSNFLSLIGYSNIPTKRLTRIRIQDEGLTLKSSSGIGWLQGDATEASLFDFSNSLEFFLDDRKVCFRGKGGFSKLIIKDSNVRPLFPTLKLENVILPSAPFFQGLHTAHPPIAYTVPVNVGGKLYAASLDCSGDISGNIKSDLADIDTLNVQTLNANEVSIPNADITLQDLTADSITSPLGNITTLTAPTLNSTNGTITNLISTTGNIGALTVSGLNAATASVGNLSVTSGSLNVNNVSANSVSSTSATITTASIQELIISRTDRAVGRFYTRPSGSAASDNPPTATNSTAAIMSYDGWFRATAVYAGSTALTSARAMKKDIIPYDESALDIINNTDIVSFIYKNDTDNVKRVGFIADDTHEILATPNHDNMDVGNSIGLLLKAVQELSEENKILKERLDRVEAYLKL
jgi:hypothetical protein